MEREYVATVGVSNAGEEPGEALVMALRKGVQTADGVYEADVREIKGRDVRLVVREGKNRMVRRWEAGLCVACTSVKGLALCYPIVFDFVETSLVCCAEIADLCGAPLDQKKG